MFCLDLQKNTPQTQNTQQQLTTKQTKKDMKPNMKVNKFTAALAALGIISLAGVAQATNPVVYLTGSTAARALVFSALNHTRALRPGTASCLTRKVGTLKL